jgi:transporter family-2 protein
LIVPEDGRSEHGGLSRVSAVSALAALLAALAGLSGSVQAAVMGRLGSRVGTLEALAFASALQALLTAALVLAFRQGFDGYGAAARQPVWLWAGGVMGAVIVFAVTFATPRIGTAATIGILVAGQLAMGVVIDRFGLFGFEQIAIAWPRALGLVLLGVGAALSLSR